MIREKKIYLIIFVLFVSFYLTGCTNDEKLPQHDFNQLIIQLDQAIPNLLDKYEATGTAIALIHNGEVIWKNGYGFADKEKGIKATANTVFQSASISKPVTAWAIMKLVEEGKLDLDTPVEDYLTRWHFPSSDFHANGVTIRRLLSHTAGLSLGGFPGFHPDDSIPTLEESLSGRNSSNVQVRIFKKPGAEFDYSGGGYMLLSLLIEEVTGEQFEDYMQREILQPLGMINSSYLWTDPLKKKTATGYNREGMPLPNYLFSSRGAANLYTTATDLANYVAAALPGPNGEAVGRNILSPETVKLMCASVAKTTEGISLLIDSVGLGYFIDPFNGKARMISHTGSNRGWRNVFAFFPETGDGIIILSNSENGRNVYIEILDTWSKWITGRTTKMCGFFNTIYQISGIISFILITSLLLYLFWTIKNRSFAHRALFWKIPDKPIWKMVLRILFHIFLPVMFIYYWYLFLQPLLQDLSPLTSGWVILGFFSWIIIAVATGIFPKQNPKEIKVNNHEKNV